MKRLAIRGALGFGVPVLVMFALCLVFAITGHPQGYYFLAAGPLCGIMGGLAYGRRWGMPIVLALCFATVGLMFSLQDVRSPWFSDVIWTGFVSAFLFWVAGGCAMLTLPADMRFNGAAALAIPGGIAGMVFQLIYGPAHFVFSLSSRKWWGEAPWEHLILWLIAGIGGGWLLGLRFQRRTLQEEDQSKFADKNPWALAAVGCGVIGMALSALYLLRSALPFGLMNSLSPVSAASDWLWGWGVLASGVTLIAATRRKGLKWSAAAVALAVTLVATSYRIQANPWKSKFNSNYAEKLLRENQQSGDAIYAGNLILAQVSLDNDDLTNAKRYLLAAAATPGAERISQSGLDTSVARVLFDRGEKDAVLEYLRLGRALWPQGAQTITRWETAIRAGRRPNFNTRGPGGGGGQQGNQQQQQQQQDR